MNSDARDKFHEFTADYLAEGELGVSGRRLAEVLLDPGQPWDVLLEAHVRRLTGDSLQSAQQVGNVCTALGFTDSEFRKRIKAGSDLDSMFRARNQMIHELDLAHDKAPGRGVRQKRGRTIGTCVAWARESLDVAQTIINAASADLNA